MSNKKKVLTITCHNVYNFGASLQEFALLKFLQKNGMEAATINYTPPYLSGHFNFLSVDNPKFKKNLLYKYILLKAPIKLWDYPRKIKFDHFSNKYNIQTKKQFHNNEDLKEDLPKADIYICGSDQVWNSKFENGKDPVFYLNFVPDNKIKISYAPSFAKENVDKNIKPLIIDNLKRFDSISVRESSGKKILEQLNFNNTHLVLDPVFLLDKKEWDDLSKHSKIKENKYILIYDFDNNPLIKKIALELKKNKGLKIISLNKNIKYADKNYYKQGPIEFIYLIKNADVILANSFHALAFSLIFDKQVYVFNRKEKINTRMRDLLKLLILDNLLITDNKYFTHDINYDIVNVKLTKLIKKYKQFLINALNNEKN